MHTKDKWYARLDISSFVGGDDTLPAHTKLLLHNRKGNHFLVVQGEIKVEGNPLIEVTVGEGGKIVTLKINDGVTLYQAGDGIYPFAVKLTHDTFVNHYHNGHDHGYCSYCSNSSHSDHWFAMTSEARRAYLVANPIAEDQFMPTSIIRGAWHWEWLARFVGDGLIHEEFRIPTVGGWQNKLWINDPLSNSRGPIQKAIAIFTEEELRLLDNCPFVAVVTWHGYDNNIKPIRCYRISVYAGGTDEDEQALQDWVNQFERHSVRVEVLKSGNKQVKTN